MKKFSIHTENITRYSLVNYYRNTMLDMSTLSEVIWYTKYTSYNGHVQHSIPKWIIGELYYPSCRQISSFWMWFLLVWPTKDIKSHLCPTIHILPALPEVQHLLPHNSAGLIATLWLFHILFCFPKVFIIIPFILLLIY
jgi:hypothetical protein